MSLLQFLGEAVALAGALVLVVAAAGLWLLPDALSRQHAGTKAVTCGLLLLALGAGLVVGELGWSVRLVGLVLILLTTVPLASHVLGRAALGETGPPHSSPRIER